MLARGRFYGSPSAALFIDIDCFKGINDTFGHAAGDELLATVAKRLNAAVRGSDTVGRFGGDEFVVIFDATHPGESPSLAAERILDGLRHPLVLATAEHASCRA
jgi:diguanylate cyclase (GGDEF)-like protein